MAEAKKTLKIEVIDNGFVYSVIFKKKTLAIKYFPEIISKEDTIKFTSEAMKNNKLDEVKKNGKNEI